RRRAGFLGDEETHVGVRGRHVGIEGMQHQRYPHGLETAPGQLRPPLAGRRRQVAAVDVREADPGLLEQAAAAQYAGASAPAGVPGPEVFLEAGAAVGFFQRRTDAVLQLAQVPLYLLGMIGLHGCSLYGRMSAPVRASRMVVGRASPPSGPTTMSSSSSAKICRTRSAVRAGLPPLRLALVDTSAPPKTRHSAAASGCAVTRTAMLSRPPVSQG